MSVSTAAKRVMVYGGGGALGGTLVAYFREKQYVIILHPLYKIIDFDHFLIDSIYQILVGCFS